ncbi:hypothetical protein [Gracilibacillus thailandensis]|uniref:Uncharacterized protein n=1 Tax=Gracilibacillus thailandensis TaxID=563735 RepID=A0A6N7R2V7_9BACI|nr:hypothetical protein [Gracilibacillus thailandensis]MRI67599.1 hypothetical protein [Gracilibacillus thailandensis]
MQINFIEHKAFNLTPYILIVLAFIGLIVSVWFVMVPYISLKNEVSSMEEQFEINGEAESEALQLEKLVEQHEQLSDYISNIEEGLIDHIALVDQLIAFLPNSSRIEHLHYIQDESIEVTMSSARFKDIAIYNESLTSQPYVTDVSFQFMERSNEGDFQAAYRIVINSNKWMEVVQYDD